jgi:hypothetical protein
MLFGRRGRFAARVGVIVYVLFMSDKTLGADIYDKALSSKYLSSPDLFVTLSGHMIAGDLEREGSGFLKLRDMNGKVVNEPVVKFSAGGALSGFDGEASVGKWFGALAYELVLGGVTVSSEASQEGRVAEDDLPNRLLSLGAPYADRGVSFKWTSASQFDLDRISYRNSYDRDEIYAGVRLTMLRGSWAAGKDAPRIQPMAYVSFGDVKVGESFSGATGGAGGASQNIVWSYNNSVDSSFAGVGGGLGASGLLGEIAQVRVGYFGALRGGFEFQQASGASHWDYKQMTGSVTGFVGKNFSGSPQTITQATAKGWANPTKELQAEETALALQAEGGISIALLTGVEIELGARLRRLDAPQVVINGEDDAFIKFTTSQEVSGFFGLKADF